jgi:succinate dehydrogenase / fumarate reductase, cytochrome b subunit
MSNARNLLQSTVGKKVVMAVTGLILVAFVIGHVAGNLLVFAGAEPLNAYSHFLKSTPELLWTTRVVLLVSVLLHIWSAVALTRAGWAARPVAYGRKEPQAATLASRTIRVGGVVLLLFIVFHLLHLTTGTIEPAPYSETDVYRNVVSSFSIPWVAAIYIVSMVALGMHLYHGAWAAFRTLGVARPSPTPMKRNIATVVAVAVWLGFTSIPLAVLAGLVR